MTAGGTNINVRAQEILPQATNICCFMRKSVAFPGHAIVEHFTSNHVPQRHPCTTLLMFKNTPHVVYRS